MVARVKALGSGRCKRPFLPDVAGDKRQRRRRRRSPYTVTCGIRASEDMRVLFQDLAEHLNLKDAEAFELAILELAKAHGTAEHVERHAAILERYLSAD